jgi:hypothetical protein
MKGKQIALIIVFVLILLWIMKRSELFGESIYIDASTEPPRDAPNIFTSGATMRVLGQAFTSTNQ